MKKFCCGDVVPGCSATFRASTEPQLLDQVAEHASTQHGIQEIPPALLAQVRAHIQEGS